MGSLLENLKSRRAGIQRKLGSDTRIPEYDAHKLAKVIPALDRAIEKIKEGTSGECDDCGDEIPPERLKAVAGATRCVGCQEIFEKKGDSSE